ncbi:MAG: PGF-CTERM sorting domain-containing protein, partial [Euryarchaeota archaeon]|nr:PGF-CTERM sorting domain-containing protein [Euryarchaeota archaeon]
LKNMNVDIKTIALIILSISIAMFAIAPIVTAGAPAATRTLSTVNPAPDSTFEVMLDLSGFQIGGVVETIPEGFTFSSTTHPSNRTYRSGQKVVFVVINETSLKYDVRAPSEGRGTLIGTWYDALNGTTGDIERTDVSVRIAETPTHSPSQTQKQTPAPSPSTPGFQAVFALTGLFTVAYMILFGRRRGNFKGGSER